MDAKTKGAWLFHHSQKLQEVTGAHDFNNILAAGKAAGLLSALSTSDQSTLDNNRVRLLAKASNINTMFELPKLLELLEAQNIIERSATGIEVLGLTTPAVVQHAAAVYADLSPTPQEEAAITLAELSSESPRQRNEVTEYLQDTCHLTSRDSQGLLEQSEDIGFVDVEDLGGDKVYFNGNLFRRQQVPKVQAVLSSLSADDRRRIQEVDALLTKHGCVTLQEVEAILGATLLEKLNAIAMYDINVVNNDRENIAFVTKPAAFSKFGHPLVEDALDLAKALVSSLTYGMTRSSYNRGRITWIEKLMKKLIDGHWVGSATAIGEDYRALELRRVIEVRPGGAYGYDMRLLKKDIGVVALEVIRAGEASEAILKLPGATVTGYTGPETSRAQRRRKQPVESKRGTRDIVMALRTGRALK